MWTAARALISITAVVVMASCGSDGDTATPSTTTTTASTAPPSTSALPATTTEAPTTTDAAPPITITTTTVTATTIAIVPTTSLPEPVDTEPPPAPENVTCAPGGGSQEVLLEWDAPADPGDVVDVRLYVNDGSGFARVNKFTVESGQVQIGANRWSAVAYPVPVSTQVQMAVTFGDAAGNESGWNPIDVYYEYSGADCLT